MAWRIGALGKVTVSLRKSITFSVFICSLIKSIQQQILPGCEQKDPGDMLAGIIKLQFDKLYFDTL